jgi:hypothetical protein
MAVQELVGAAEAAAEDSGSLTQTQYLTGSVQVAAETTGGVIFPTVIIGGAEAVAQTLDTTSVVITSLRTLVQTVSEASANPTLLVHYLNGLVGVISETSAAITRTQRLHGDPAVAISQNVGRLIPLGRAGYEIPYPLGLGGVHTVELEAGQVSGQSTVTASLKVANVLTGTSQAASETSGALNVFVPPPVSVTGAAEAVARINSFLFVGEVDGDGDPIQELAGTSNGSSTVVATGLLTVNTPDPKTHDRFLYLLLNVGVGFDPTDEVYSGVGTLVTHNSPDGNVRDFDRFLYQLTNVGVGFDPTDTVPGAVSQTFPDGHTRDDFARYLYQYVAVIKARGPQHDRLIVEPGVRDSQPPIPRAKPPVNKL